MSARNNHSWFDLAIGSVLLYKLAAASQSVVFKNLDRAGASLPVAFLSASGLQFQK